jgi:hypothetical protein
MIDACRIVAFAIGSELGDGNLYILLGNSYWRSRLSHFYFLSRVSTNF